MLFAKIKCSVGFNPTELVIILTDSIDEPCIIGSIAPVVISSFVSGSIIIKSGALI